MIWVIPGRSLVTVWRDLCSLLENNRAQETLRKQFQVSSEWELAEGGGRLC